MRARSKRKLAAFLLTPLLLCGLFLSYFNFRLRPLLTAVAAQKARVLAAEAVNEASMRVLNAESGQLITLSHDEKGAPSMIACDTAACTRVRTRLSEEILEILKEQDYATFFVPLGTLLDGEMLSGRGPGFEVRLVPVGSCAVDLAQDFSSAGINQTLFTLYAQVSVQVSILLPNSREPVQVDTRVNLAQVVLVGEVPQVFVQR